MYVKVETEMVRRVSKVETGREDRSVDLCQSLEMTLVSFFCFFKLQLQKQQDNKPMYELV